MNVSAKQTLALWGDMLALSACQRLLDVTLWQTLGLNVAQWGIVTIGVIGMTAVSFQSPRVGQSTPTLRARIAKRPVLCGIVCAVAISVILIFGCYGQGYDARAFIYGQF